jgi:hypothetical protein
LEDTAVVTDKGCDIYGEGARGWNRAGTGIGLQTDLSQWER